MSVGHASRKARAHPGAQGLFALRVRRLQVGRIEAFGKPLVSRREESAGIVLPMLAAAEDIARLPCVMVRLRLRLSRHQRLAKRLVIEHDKEGVQPRCLDPEVNLPFSLFYLDLGADPP
jgi:hypothetical protein